MNSEEEPPKPAPDTSSANIFSATVSKKDQELERLQSENQNLKDLRKEERFGWIVALLALINYLLLKDVQNLLAPLIVFILELIALLVLARRSGMEYIEIIISRLISMVTSKIDK